jgi:hypothetical protein
MTVLIREDTGEMAIVRVIDPGVHVSAPYSRAVGLLDKWAKAERRAVDEFAAWIEGQTAQAHAEMRLLCDELGLPVAWAEIPDQPSSVKPAEPVAPFDRGDPHDRIGLGMGAALRARYGTIGGPSPFVPRRPSDVLAEMYDARAVQTYMDADTSTDMPGRLPRTMLEPTSIDFDDDCTPRPQPTERRSWSAEWAAFRDDVKDMWRDLRRSLAWWRKEED